MTSTALATTRRPATHNKHLQFVCTTRRLHANECLWMWLYLSANGGAQDHQVDANKEFRKISKGRTTSCFFVNLTWGEVKRVQKQTLQLFYVTSVLWMNRAAAPQKTTVEHILQRWPPQRHGPGSFSVDDSSDLQAAWCCMREADGIGDEASQS